MLTAMKSAIVAVAKAALTEMLLSILIKKKSSTFFVYSHTSTTTLLDTISP